VVLGAVALLALGASAYLTSHFEQQITAARVGERAFDLSAREAASALGHLNTSQLSYAIAGQDPEVLAVTVKEHADDATRLLEELRTQAIGDATRTALARANDAMAEFAGVDRRVRDYLKSGQQLMASDVLMTEGGATDALGQLNSARAAERQALDEREAGLRKRQLTALAGGAGVAAVAVILLVMLAPRRSEATAAPEAAATLSIAHSASFGARSRTENAPEVAVREAPPTSAYVTARPAGPVLRAASKLCTDFGRVSDIEELKLLIGQAADVMDASGIVIWIAAPDGTYVHPALSHGYTPQVMARMTRVLRSADNAAAAAYRTGQMQIVLARPGESNGAVVAPLLSADGCIGALSAEIRGGGESSDSVQALAAIFAAQLASVLNTSSAAAHEHRTTATGTI
jgi:hypothetical protein